MHLKTAIFLSLGSLVAAGVGVGVYFEFFRCALTVFDGSKKYCLKAKGALSFPQAITIKSIDIEKGYTAQLSTDAQNYGSLTGPFKGRVDSTGYIPGGVPQIGIKTITVT